MTYTGAQDSYEKTTLDGVTISGVNVGYNPNNVFGGRLVLWLDADKGITIDTTPPASVSIWADQSTYRYNVHQPTKANQPGHVTNAVNGHMSVFFSGLPVVMITTNTVAPVLFSVAGDDKPYSIFSCLKGLTNVGAATAISFGRTAFNNGRIGVRPYQALFSLNIIETDDGGTSMNSDLSTIGGNTNRFDIISIVSDGTTVISRRNNFTSTNQTVNVGTKSLDLFGLGAFARNGGATGFWRGEIAEVLVLTNQCTPYESEGIKSYLNHKYNRY